MRVNLVTWSLVSLSGCNDDFVIPSQWNNQSDMQRNQVKFLIDPYYHGIPASGVARLHTDVNHLRASVVDLDAKSTITANVLRDLQNEQIRLSNAIITNQVQFDDHKKKLVSDYEALLQGLKQLAQQHSQSPNSPIYVNSFSIGGVNMSQHPITPFAVPLDLSQKVSASSSNEPGAVEKLTEALIDYKASLIAYLDKLQADLDSHKSERLNALKDKLAEVGAATPSPQLLTSVTQEVNNAVAEINKQPRVPERRGTEVWIDASQVHDKDQRKRIVRLLGKESKRKHQTSDQPEKADISPVLSITVHRHSRHSRLRIYRDVSSHQMKLVGICKSDSKEPFMFSFSCQDDNRSMMLLTEDRKKNKLVDAVMKVTCHSKSFAKHLVTDPAAREDRCYLSRWSQLASSVSMSDSTIGKTDKDGKRAFEMLKRGEGCFEPSELDIEIDCLKKRLNK